ncbi:MAG: AAA family ATPase [Anaerolineae bacterium]|nr:AAA family ATPase [Anaerolineae bacterium]
MSILPILSSYLPHPLAARVLTAPEHSLLGQGDRQEVVVLFADVVGFTPIAEALGQVGLQGAEELTRILNATFAPLIERAHWRGGVVGKFAGDAFTTLFSGDDAAHRALACAVDLHDQIVQTPAFQTPAGALSIQMKFGLAAGTILQAVVGTQRRAEFVFAGPPLSQAGSAQSHARPGEIILHATFLACLPPSVADLSPLEGGYARLERLRKAAPYCPLPAVPAASDPDGAMRALRPFLPLPIYDRLLAGSTDFVNEHRRVTIVFAGFAGIDYTAADAMLQLDSYVSRCIEVVNRFDGYLHQVFVGDKGSEIIVLFGAPIAHEDGEERALLCAHAFRELTADFEGIISQQIGVSSGRLFAGNIGSARRQSYTVIGDGINLAARLMQAAAPGQILVSETTYQAVSQQGTWRPLPPFAIKGRAAPVTAWELVAPPSSRSPRLLEVQYQLPMVGRREELSAIEEILAQVRRDRRAHVVGLTAEAGMGKSRLAAGIIGLALAKGFAVFAGHGVSHGTTTPYLAWRPIVRRLLGIAEGHEREEQIAAARHALAAVHPDLPLRLPLLGDLLGFDVPDNEITASLDANLRRESLFALLGDLLRHLAHETLLLVLEDAHWLDELSRELTRYIVQVVRDRPLFLLTVYRPPEIEQTPSLWSPPPAHAFTEFRLAPFTAQESGELVRLKLAGRELPPNVVEQLEQRAQGNPFFIEEFINLLQNQALDLDDPDALAAIQVPSSLQTLITSRIDQLAEAEKMTLRVASVIGRLFRAGWLLAIYPGEIREDLLRRNLARLADHDLLQLDRPDPELEYLFKHTLTQEVAYGTLSFANRRMLHERTANYLEQAYAAELESWYPVLAFHCRRARLAAREFDCLCMAAKLAVRQYAARDAVDFYSRAIELIHLHQLADPATEFDLRCSRFEQLGMIQEYERRNAEVPVIAALAEKLDPPRQVQSLIIRGQIEDYHKRRDLAASLYEQAIRLARQHDDRVGLLAAIAHRGEVHFSEGEYELGKAAHRQVVEDAGEDGWTEKIRSCNYLGWIAYDEGDYQECRSYWEQGLEIARAHHDKVAEAQMLKNLGVVYEMTKYLDRSIEYLDQALTMSQQIGNRSTEQAVLSVLAATWHGAGYLERGLEYLQQALELAERANNLFGRAYYRSRMAEIIVVQGGELVEAERLGREAMALGYPDLGPEPSGWLLHSLGMVLRHRGGLDEAQEKLEEAARIRREIKQIDCLLLTLAELGELHWQKRDPNSARQIVDEITSLLFPVEGAERECVEAGFTCYRILQWLGEPVEARRMLNCAWQTLQRQASRIATAELRHSFLGRIPVHRQVAVAYRAEMGDP